MINRFKKLETSKIVPDLADLGLPQLLPVVTYVEHNCVRVISFLKGSEMRL
jgi:hypothetical protein